MIDECESSSSTHPSASASTSSHVGSDLIDPTRMTRCRQLFLRGIVIFALTGFFSAVFIRQQRQEIIQVGSGTNTISVNDDTTMTTPSLLPSNYRQLAYDLAVRRSKERSASTFTPYHNLQEFYGVPEHFGKTHKVQDYQVLNLIRIPKAGSSQLSVVARAIAGCHPDGYPCCATLDKSCPRDDLLCNVVRGCTDHRPRYNITIHHYQHAAFVTAMTNATLSTPSSAATTELQTLVHVPMITGVRDPTDRLLSAFFYKGDHRPKPIRNHSWEIFQNDYIPQPKYRNVLTKMLNGFYAYSNHTDPTIVDRHGHYGIDFDNETVAARAITVAKQRLCNMTVFGLSLRTLEPAASSAALGLLLYESGPVLSKLQPNPVVFGLNATDRTEPTIVNHDGAVRINHNEEYEIFKHEIFVQNHGQALVDKYNRADHQVYQFALALYCSKLHQIPGFVQDVRQTGLAGLYPGCLEPDASDDEGPNHRPSVEQLCAV